MRTGKVLRIYTQDYSLALPTPATPACWEIRSPMSENLDNH
jgi:hypothetical protein